MLLLLQLVVGRKMAAKVGIKEVEARGATEVDIGVVEEVEDTEEVVELAHRRDMELPENERFQDTDS